MTDIFVRWETDSLVVTVFENAKIFGHSRGLCTKFSPGPAQNTMNDILSNMNDRLVSPLKNETPHIPDSIFFGRLCDVVRLLRGDISECFQKLSARLKGSAHPIDRGLLAGTSIPKAQTFRPATADRLPPETWAPEPLEVTDDYATQRPALANLFSSTSMLDTGTISETSSTWTSPLGPSRVSVDQLESSLSGGSLFSSASSNYLLANAQQLGIRSSYASSSLGRALPTLSESVPSASDAVLAENLKYLRS